MERLLEEARKTLDGGWRSALNFAVEERLPNRRRALLLLNKLRERLGAEPPDYLKGDFLLHLTKLFSYSAFLGEFLVSHPEVLPELESTYTRTFKPADFKVQPGREEADVLRNLRVYRHTQMARVVLRDILNLAPFTELTRDVTLIHDACIREALKFAQEKMRERYGEPSCGFLVVAMGKAGGFELNYSSDVDMMFVYDSRYGETAGGKYGKLQNHDYFTILSKYITELLSKPTAEGRCMVVDLRLRPNGSLGPLCNDLEALEQYYTAVAMPWERFALLKARPCAGDVKKTGLEFLKLVRALIFRKYIDLTLVEELLRIKELIKSKVAKKGRKVDVKLGEGGIREVEFIVQAFQLMYGGRFPDIRSTNTLSALQKLRRWGFLNEKEWQELKDAYILLRRTEHMLQITNFRQTQTFHPESEEAQELAVKLGFPSRAEFLRKLRETMETVNLYFGRFFPTGDRKTLSSVGTEELARMGFKEPEAVKRLLNALLSTKSLSPGEANRLDVMGDELLRTLLTAPEPQTTLKNLISLLETKEGKLLLFSLMHERRALKLVFFLLSCRGFFVEKIKRTPEISEYIFNPEYVEGKITLARLLSELAELKSDILVKNLAEVRTVLKWHMGKIDIEELMEELTETADFSVHTAYEETSPEFSVASLGKHGSREMNINSDMDLLFISKEPCTDLTSALRFMKKLKDLGYKVDTRLRPFGEKGELIFTVKHLESYTSTVARTWERLAFTRFRFLKGELREEVENIVNAFVFGKPFTEETLDEVVEMRNRLERELGRGAGLKYSAGGIVDLEFMGYIYQLLRKRRIGTTLKALKALCGEEKAFADSVKLYRALKTAETTERLFGTPALSDDKIATLKKETRSCYERFLSWVRKNL